MAVSTALETKPPTTETKPGYVALVYSPQNGLKTSVLGELLDIKQTIRTPFVRYFQFTIGTELLTITVHPGTNLGYHTRGADDSELIRKIPVEWIESIQKNKLDTNLLESSFELIYPTKETAEIPQYADFSEADALKLIASHTHENWIDAALKTETRTRIKTAAEDQKKLVLVQRKKLMEGQ